MDSVEDASDYSKINKSSYVYIVEVFSMLHIPLLHRLTLVQRSIEIK